MVQNSKEVASGDLPGSTRAPPLPIHRSWNRTANNYRTMILEHRPVHLNCSPEQCKKFFQATCGIKFAAVIPNNLFCQ